MPRRSLNREQAWLLPPSLDDMLPEDHAVRFVAALVAELDAGDWCNLGVDAVPPRRGAPSYPPEALLSIWLYGFMTGVRSSRKLEEACHERIPFIWLAGRHRPDHNTLWRFYQAHRDQMRLLFRRTVRIAVKSDLIDLAIQAVDGTRVSGNASKDRTFSKKGLIRLLRRTDEAIANLEAQNATGGDPSPLSLPVELLQARALQERVRTALSEVEAEDGPNPSSGSGHRSLNLSDPDAKLMKSRHGFVAGYNAQAMVSPVKTEAKAPPKDAADENDDPSEGGGPSGGGMFITGAGLTQEGDDHAQLMPMIEQAAVNTGAEGTKTVTVADAGYHSGTNLQLADEAGRQVLTPPANDRKRANPFDKSHFTYRSDTGIYICPNEQPLSFIGVVRRRGRGRANQPIRRYRAPGAVCRVCPAFGTCTNNRRGRTLEVGLHESLLVKHRALMDTEWAKALYSKRKQIVEPVFGIIKEQLGLKRFLLRGFEGVRAEWTLLATAFNLRTLYRTWRTRVNANSSAAA